MTPLSPMTARQVASPGLGPTSPQWHARNRSKHVSVFAQKLEKQSTPDGPSALFSGFRVFNNVQSFILSKTPDDKDGTRVVGLGDPAGMEQLASQAQASASSAQATAQDAKQAQASVESALKEMRQLEAMLTQQAEEAARVGIGSDLSVPLVVLPSFLAPPPPPTRVVEREREVEVEAEREVEVGPQFVTGEGGESIVYEKKAYGTGQEVLLQGFNWDSHRHNWYQKLYDEAEWFGRIGFTLVWMPPPTDSVSREGYMPRDLYNLNSAYGSPEMLKRCIAKLKEHGVKPLADAVLNHRCAHFQNKDGVWNRFGGKLDWDERAICSDDPNYKGKGNKKTGDLYAAAPNIDHSQDFVKAGISTWLNWLLEEFGYEGFRLDYVRGYSGKFIKGYMMATQPDFCVGEYWDSLAYDWGGKLEYNQNAHRQRIINWMNSAGGLATCFDMTTKGILHAVFEGGEYWRLKDDQGKPPGVLGWWPSRTVTFLENHDTGSSQGHWRFPHHGLAQGYVYILTHPGTPTVFYDHIHDGQLQQLITDLIALRRKLAIHVNSSIKIHKADNSMYAAEIDKKLLMKIGPGTFTPKDGEGWKQAYSGHHWSVWTRS